VSSIRSTWPEGAFVLGDVTVASSLLLDRALTAPGADTARVDIGVSNGMIDFVATAGAGRFAGRPIVALDGDMVWPCYVEAHTHLDSSQIWSRTPNPDGSFAGAAGAMIADRTTHWTGADMRRRMDFSLRCAFAHGTGLMRTHLASQNDQIDQRWAIFRELREEWKGRIDLQAVPLISTEALRDPDLLESVAGLVSRSGGVLGAFAPMTPAIEAVLHDVFAAAERHGLGLDFHADETADTGSQVLAAISRVAIARRFLAPILVGHCCSLAMSDADTIDRTLDLAAQAGVSVVSLPACNLYLQDRRAGRTPRWRGLTLVHEMAARGIGVAFGGDNCRDPFHAYGDFDMHQVFGDAVRIAQLDHPIGDWPASVSSRSAQILGRPDWGIGAGRPADLILFRTRSLNELLSRPQSDRRLMRGGVVIDAPLPDYRELDPTGSPLL
jgi:cytosine/creatinine deaminase